MRDNVVICLSNHYSIRSFCFNFEQISNMFRKSIREDIIHEDQQLFVASQLVVFLILLKVEQYDHNIWHII